MLNEIKGILNKKIVVLYVT